MAAGHYQRIVDEFFCADANAADPAVVSESESEGAAAGRLDSDALATVECGEAGPGDNTDSVVGESDVTQSSRDTPKAHSTVSVHTEAHGVTFDFGFSPLKGPFLRCLSRLGMVHSWCIVLLCTSCTCTTVPLTFVL